MKYIKYVILLVWFTACKVIQPDPTELLAKVVTEPKRTMKGYHFKVIPIQLVGYRDGMPYLIPLKYQDTIDTYIPSRAGRNYKVGKTYYFTY